MPFLLNSMGAEPRHNYTAVIYVQIGAALGPNAALYKLVKTITRSQFVDRVSTRCLPAFNKIPKQLPSPVFQSDSCAMGSGSATAIEETLAPHQSHTSAHYFIGRKYKKSGSGSGSGDGNGSWTHKPDDWRTTEHITTFPALRWDSNRCCALPGRRCHTQHGWAGLCLHGVEGFPGAHCWLSGQSPFLGWFQGN